MTTTARHPRTVISDMNFASPMVWMPASILNLIITLFVSLPIFMIFFAAAKNAEPTTLIILVVIMLSCFASVFVLVVRHRLRTRPTIWCVRRGFVVRPGRRPHVRTQRLVRLRYSEVGHVTLGDSNRLLLRVGLVDVYRIPVSNFAKEDELEKVLEHFETHAPDHLVSVDDRGDLRYTRSWSLDEVLSGYGPTSSVVIEVTGQKPRRCTMRTDDALWQFDDTEGIVRLPGESQGVLRILRRRRVLCGPGTVLASVERRNPTRMLFTFGCEDRLRVDLDRRAIAWNDAPVGSYRGGLDRCEVRFDSPVPQVLALLAAVTVISRAGKIG